MKIEQADRKLLAALFDMTGDSRAAMLNPEYRHKAYVSEKLQLIAAYRQSEREACAKVCEDQIKIFGSTKYAVGQPMSSFGERFASGRCAEAIRERTARQ